MPPLRIAYANVFVHDFERALDFYANVLKLPVRVNDAQFGYAAFATERISLGIARVDSNDKEQARLVGRHTGIGFGVPDLDAAHRELASAGVQFTMPPERQPWGGYMALFSDPEGNVFYLDQLSEA